MRSYLGTNIAGMLALAAIGESMMHAPASSGTTYHHKKSVMPTKEWQKKKKRLRMAKKSRSINRKP